MTDHVGDCAIVLHTHLPWLAHAGKWPVGEEWLHQAWASSYLPVFSMLERLAGEGLRDVLTLGVTPVLAAMLDDPYLLREFHDWLGNWSVRAWELAARPGPPAELAPYEHRLATAALEQFDTQWQHGGSPVLRRLADSGVVELLGGPAAHPFQPLLAEPLVPFSLSAGLDDAALRLGRRPAGIWAPECGYRPGLEAVYAAAGVTHFVVDGPALHGDTSAGRLVGDSDVVAFGRDLDVTYRVWSPRSGYPGGRWYRDFHTFDHPTGVRTARVTTRRTPPEAKRPYQPDAAAAAAARDAADFVSVVRARLQERPGLVVVAWDTELFGHWWHEGPAWLEQVIRLLPSAGVRLVTLRDAPVRGRASLPAGSWGTGKDWRVWDGPLLDEQRAVQQRLLDVVRKAAPRARSFALDQLAREALLVSASDWAFCVAKDSAADYARSRHAVHVSRFSSLASLVEAGRWDAASRLALSLRAVDGPFGHLDARAIMTAP